MSDVEERLKQYWRDFAEAFAYPLQEDRLLGRFVNDQNVTGAYAEAWIRETVRTMLPQYKVSTGTVIRASTRTHHRPAPQCDLIVWDPSELPAVFERGEFAVVPNHSARALIEVKRTCPDAGALMQQLADRRQLLTHEYRHQVFGVVLRHPSPLFRGDVGPTWFMDVPGAFESPRATRLFSTDDWKPDVDGIFALIYFLAQVADSERWPRGDAWKGERSTR